MQQKPYSDALCHVLPATQTLVLQVQVPGWDAWAGILGLGSLGSDHDICDGGLQLHGEKAFPAKTGSHEPGGEAASAVSSKKKPLWPMGPAPSHGSQYQQAGLNKSLVIQRPSTWRFLLPAGGPSSGPGVPL